LPRLKEEVALGVPKPPIGKVSLPGEPLVGEIKWRGAAGAEVDWKDRLSVAQLKQLQRPADGDDSKCYIKDFLHIQAQQQQHARLNIDANGIKSLKVKWDAVEHMMAIDFLNSGVSQPVFACELKSLIQQYVQHVISELTTR